MRKFRILAMMLVAMLAFGAVAATAGKKKTKKYDTTISAKYVDGGSTDPYDPYGNAQFKGTVKSKKSFCKKKRKVVAKVKSEGEKIGSDLTNKKGKFKIDASGFGPGKYKLTAKKKTKTKKKGNGTKVKTVCKSDTATVKVG